MGDKGISVLVVDADPRALQSTVSILEKQERIGKCQTASSGYEAITKALSGQHEVVLMEVNMETPLAGLFALREITGASTAAQVIMYTACEDEDMIIKAFTFGAVNYLFKSTSASRLARAVIAAHMGRASIAHEVAPVVRAEFRRMRLLQEDMAMLVKVALSLTATEIDILRLLLSGVQPKEISRIRFIEPSTVKTHTAHILRKFNLDSMAQVLELLRSTNFFSLLE